MSVKDIEAMFARVGVRRSGDLVERRFSHHLVQRALDEGIIVRPVMRRSLGFVPGILVSAEANVDDMRDEAIAMVLTNGRAVVAGQTAGKRHELTDFMPKEISLLVEHDRSRLPRQTTFEARRCRNEDLLTVEVGTVDTDIGIAVRITSPARTVVDLLHGGRRDSTLYANSITALTRFLKAGGETGELLRLADRLYPESQPYIDGLANSANEMMSAGPQRRMSR